MSKTPVCRPCPECYRAIIELDLPPAASFVYRGNNNMSTALPNPNVMLCSGMDCEIPAQDVVVAGDPDAGKFCLAGALTAFRSLTYFRVIRRGRISHFEVYQPHIKPGEEPEKILILTGSDWRDLLVRYAEASAKAMGVQKIDAHKNLTGYCSWYYYYKQFSEANLLENIDVLAKNRSPYAARYIQIDDGYQAHQGDWLDRREDWPTPLDQIAKKITDAGMEAGIWTMPFAASTSSRVFTEHPDWFVHDAHGKAIAIRGWSPAPDRDWVTLDPTVPEAREHLRHVFTTFRSMGFTYFKMDALGYALINGVRHDPNATPVSAFRLGLQTIRDAVPDSRLLVCCPPFMACLGLAENARVSNDTSRYFDDSNRRNFPISGCDIRTAARLTLAHWWKYDRWFRCDPDSLMARQDNAWYNRCEAKYSVLTGILTGVCLTSDHLARIGTDRNRLLGVAQRIRMRNVRPLDWPAGSWPKLMEGTVNGKYAVAIFNDSESKGTWKFEEIGLPAECKELLEDAVYSNEITLEPHDAALLIGK